ncbi:MAG: helicase [Campylobacter sp.]|nr:helicase [Campylobacter sp.]
MTTKIIEAKLLDPKFQRKTAKIGMGVCLGVAAITTLNLKNQTSRKLHSISGYALIGFSIWHANLYGSRYSKFIKRKHLEIVKSIK